ncbi:MAG: hypothetical protein QXV63_00035 [Candidatus Aenigmatarchaeota archaeon]
MALLKEIPTFDKCPKCGKSAKIKYELISQNEKTSVVVKIYECSFCGYRGPRI